MSEITANTQPQFAHLQSSAGSVPLPAEKQTYLATVTHLRPQPGLTRSVKSESSDPDGQKSEKSAILGRQGCPCINLSRDFVAWIAPVEDSHRQNPGCIADFSDFCPPRQGASEKLSISLLFDAKRMHLTACFMHFKTSLLDHQQGGPIELASLPHPTRILQHAHAHAHARRRTTNRCNTR